MNSIGINGMAMGREGDRQGDLIGTWAEMPGSPGQVFYDRLQEVLVVGGFDRFVEGGMPALLRRDEGRAVSAAGALLPDARVGYGAGIASASEQGIAGRCSDSLAVRDLLRLESREAGPDQWWLSKTRGRLPHDVHATVFGWVLKRVAERGLVHGQRIGVDAATMAATAALRTIVRREDGRTWCALLTPMARERERHQDAGGERSGPHRSRPHGQEAVALAAAAQDLAVAAQNLAPISAAPTKQASAERTGRRHGRSRARRLAGPQRRGLQDAHCRTQATELVTLAW
jgi:hypothetical protein